jgi:transforming growth factor-beta-induced protein
MFQKAALILSATMMVCGLAHAKPQSDIVDIAAGSADFSTLVAAVSAADLVATLKTDGPFTVFAPTNAAFAKLPAGTVDALLKDIPALTNILLYHVSAGDISSAQLMNAGEVATIQGQKLIVTKRSGEMFVNDSRILARVEAKNGVIYVIDTVLLP